MEIKFNPLTGKFDLINSNNFSYEEIETGKTVTVPSKQQMIVHEVITVTGLLVLNGALVLIS